MSINSRAKLEARLKVLETGKVEKSAIKKEKSAGKGGFHAKSETLTYDDAADSTMKRKIEEVKEEEIKAEVNSDEPAKKKSKKEKKSKKDKESKDGDDAMEDASAEPEAESGEKKKKKKKKSKVAELTESVENVEIGADSSEKKKKKKKKKSKGSDEE